MAEKTTLAKPYAKAIFEIASQDNTVDSWLEKLELLSQVSSVDTVLEVIKNPEISTDDTINMFTDICKDMLDDKSVNLLRVAGKHSRLDLFPEIAREYAKLKAEVQGTLEAEVISAYMVNATQKKLITENLKKRFNKEITITTVIDKSLIAGIVIRAGDLVIDGSVSSQIKKLTHTLLR